MNRHLRHVLITRSVDDALPLADAVAAKGYIPVIEPMLQIIPLPFSVESDYQAVVFTSANGVRVTAAKIEARDHPVYCVGERTAEIAKDRGWDKVISAGGDVESLNALLEAEEFGGEAPLLHLSGEDIAKPVTAGKTPVERIAVYKAGQAERFSSECFDLMMQHKFAAALFFSARTAQAFAALVRKFGCTEPLTVTKALCLADSVVKSVEHLPWQEVLVADKPDRAAMLDLLEDISN